MIIAACPSAKIGSTSFAATVSFSKRKATGLARRERLRSTSVEGPSAMITIGVQPRRTMAWRCFHGMRRLTCPRTEEIRSGGASLVAMVETADLWEGDHAPFGDGLSVSWCRRVFRQREMRSGFV